MFKKEKNIECQVIYNPRSFNSKEKSKVNKKQFLAAGRFNHQKGFDLLIESFNTFSKTNDNWKLVIVGEGKEKIKSFNLIEDMSKECRIKSREFDVENIRDKWIELIDELMGVKQYYE